MKKLTAIIILCSLLLLCSCGNKNSTETDFDVSHLNYATVNGEIVTSEEIEYFKMRSRSDIINEYAEKYGVKEFSDFWDKEFDGKTPSKALEERALDEAVKAKIKLVLMRENGIYDNISFNALLIKAQKFNEENKDAQGKVGIKTVDVSGFYTYYVSTGEMELKNILAEGELKPTEDELAAAKEENPQLTENGLISKIVDEKYEKMISEAIENAKIERLG